MTIVTDAREVHIRQLDRRLSPTVIAELVAAYEAGTPTPELCRQFSLSKGEVLNLLREAGVQMRRQPVTETEITQAVTLRDEGLSYDEIARRLGKAQTTVWRVLSRGRLTILPDNSRNFVYQVNGPHGRQLRPCDRYHEKNDVYAHTRHPADVGAEQPL